MSDPPPAGLLIAAFGPFPGMPTNPAESAVKRLAQARLGSESAIGYVVLPTTWDGAFPALARAVAAHDPAAVLIVGVAGDAAAFRIETRARNRVGDGRVDADGVRSAASVVAMDGPDAVPAACRTGQMVEAIAREGLACTLSQDAGDYLCNHTFYRALTALPGQERAIAFLHVPPLGPDVSLDDIVRAVRAAAFALTPKMSPA